VCNGRISIIVACCHTICDGAGWLLSIYSHVGAGNAGLGRVLYGDGKAACLGVARRVPSLVCKSMGLERIDCDGLTIASNRSGLHASCQGHSHRATTVVRCSRIAPQSYNDGLSERSESVVKPSIIPVPGWRTEVVRLAGQTIVGAWASRTTICKLHVAVLPT
jgi:hypothetical protein